MRRRKQPQQLGLFGDDPPAMDDRSSMEPEGDEGPILFDQARILTGGDAYRILCGDPRGKVVAERRAILVKKGG